MATLAELEAKIKKLEVRMTEAEDERAIRELLARYGYTADVCKDKEYVDLFTEDGVMDTVTQSYQGNPRWEGKMRIAEFIADPKGHHLPDKYGKRMHVQGNNVACHIKGDEAVVNSYSIVLLRKGDQVVLDGAGNNQWKMKKIAGKWYFRERRRRLVGGPGYHQNLDATPD